MTATLPHTTATVTAPPAQSGDAAPASARQPTSVRPPKPRRPVLGGARRWTGTIGSGARAVWRWVGPVVHAVRPLGWIALLGGGAAFAASRLWGWQEFTVLALALAGAFLVAVLSAVGTARYRVELDLQTGRVVVGQRAAGRLTVTNAARHRLLPARMELPVGPAVGSFALPGLPRGDTHEEDFLIPTERRAVVPVGPARSVRGDAFGLIRRVIAWTRPEVLYVHPRTVALMGSAAGFLKDLEGQATKEISNDDVSFHALRRYVPGDDWRYIHWKTSARTLATPARSLMVRQFVETRRSHLVVTLSTRLGDYATDDEFELAVEVAASLGVQAFRESRQLSVLASGAAIPSPTAQRMLDGFSGVEVSEDADGIVAVSRAAALFAPDVSVAFVVCGGQPTPSQIRAAALAFPIGVRVLAVRAVPGAVTHLNRIGDTSVLTVGSLDDVGRALRWAVHT